MKILINSHINSKIALEHLLESMKALDEFEQYEFIICIGGYYNCNYELFKNKNITYIHCNHNSIDFTALITMFELFSENKNDYYLYLHDTCRIGNQFYNKLKAIESTINIDISSIRINKRYSMNIGVYSQKNNKSV
jgi:hypothetical protein